jgi:hypothetical protein
VSDAEVAAAEEAEAEKEAEAFTSPELPPALSSALGGGYLGCTRCRPLAPKVHSRVTPAAVGDSTRLQGRVYDANHVIGWHTTRYKRV